MLESIEYERKPFKVAVVEVTAENMEQVARWTGGKIREDEEGKHVKIRVHRPLTPKQSQAYVGDVVLKAVTGFKVYTQAAFKKSFRKVSDVKTPVTMPDEVVVTVPQPKKRSAKKAAPKPGPVQKPA